MREGTAVRGLCCLLLCLLLCAASLPPARAEGLTLPDVPDWEEDDDGLTPLTDDELLDALSQQDGDFVVLPEGFTMSDADVVTLLLIGSDSYDDTRGRSDTVILAQLNTRTHAVKLVSFLRDLFLPIPGKGSNRLNASYSWGGERLLRRTLEKNFGVTADAYVEVNFARLVRVIDAVGGVEVDVSEKEMGQVNSILRFYNVQIGAPEEDELLENFGESVHLTGKQALCFARIRKIDGDVQRTNRQRKVLEALFRKASGLGWLELSALVLDNLDAVTTDLRAEDILALLPLVIRCRDASFETLTIPMEGTYHFAMEQEMSVVKANIRKNQEALWAFLDLD